MGLDNPLHIAAVVVILLLLFGARRVPRMARDLGTGMREFKEGLVSSARAASTTTADLPPAPDISQPAMHAIANTDQPPMPSVANPPARPAVESEPAPQPVAGSDGE
jgi:sec-independent protein translocase protein TatA